MGLTTPLSHAERPLPDEGALCALLEELRPRLELFARKRGLSAASEDVVQETLLAAVNGFRDGRFDGRSSIHTWIYAILRHKIGDQRRADARELDHLLPLPEEGQAPRLPAGSQGRSSTPEMVVLVQEALEALPARHWLILMLNKPVGLTTREIAPLLKLSPGRTGAILAEAQKRFRQAVRDTEGHPPIRRLLR